MRILLVEPYCGGSHQAWAEGYAAHSRHEVRLLTLPARFWKWRMQGGAVTLAESARDLGFAPDLILASDMLNLPAFIALTRDYLPDVPAAMYCHENQLTYPPPPGEKRDLTYGMVNWLSMLTAKRVFFNSAYHLEAWFDELPRMLKHFPDHSHLHHVAQVRERSEVLSVGCDLRRLDVAADEGRRSGDTTPLLLWNQRWEYDKDPKTFLRAVETLADERFEFRLALAGPSYGEEASEFEEARERLGERIIQFGHASEERYAELLRRSDVVVSTALHEFFGVSVVEAIYSGCFPILPNRLSYPELIPASFHEHCLYGDFTALLERLRWAVTNVDEAGRLAKDLRAAMVRYDWEELGPRYDSVLAEVAGVS
ncbi:MAG: DUF3524 domain-containing protein [Anaerolineales bacterium]|nr:MAG: DUF3524 domain-containing protein [Anaerolineales bacterium]